MSVRVCILFSIAFVGGIGSIDFAKQAPTGDPSRLGSGSVSVWLSTADLLTHLEPQTAVAFGPDAGSAPYTIDVDESQLYQVIDGFGASFTDSSARLIFDAPQRDTIMQQLFDPAVGIGLSYVRQPIGASDFADTRYTFDDVPEGQTDPTLDAFSIDHDRAYILPLLRQALSLNPHLKVMASPWSPPGWMKTSGSMIGGSLQTAAYAPYAQYFVKFIQAYAAEGVPIDAVTVQNEPLLVPNDYPGMSMSTAEQAAFIKNNLGPAFAAAGISTKILAYDYNWASNYPITVLDDPGAKAYIAGSAFHCYDGHPSAQTAVKTAHPDRDIYLTECSGGTWKSGRAEFRFDIESLIIGSIRNWAKAVQKWNLALDQNNGPHTGGCGNCVGLVTIDSSDGHVTYNPEYYALGHASKFVVPGARRIASSTNGTGSIESVAFKNPDGTKVLVVLNAGEATTFKVHSAGHSFGYTLGAGDVATFIWSDTGASDGTVRLDRKGLNATASSSASSDSPANALDGNDSTRWSTGASQSNGQWFRVDMGQVNTISSITFDGGTSGDDYPRAYQVLLSADGVNFTEVGSGTGSQFFTVPFSPQSARYIEIQQTGAAGSWWSLHELNVYGKLALSRPAESGSYLLERTGWSATASASAIGDVPENALDGNQSTRWSTGVPESNGQWLQVDMGQVNTVSSITIDAGGSSGDYPRGYVVQLSTDGTTLTQVASGSGSGQVVNVAFAALPARYIRITQTGTAANWWSIHEVNVWGVSSHPPINRAGWTATASSIPSDPCCTADLPASALDGSMSTRWSTGVPESNGQWFQVDMGQTSVVERIVIDAGTSSSDYPRGYQVLVSTDGVTFTVAASGTGSTGTTTVSFAPQAVRYIKIVQTGSSNYWWSISELSVYACDCAAATQ